LKLNFSTDVIRRESPSFNVVGLLPGSDPKLKVETIVIGAHYDHLGRGGEGSLAPREGDIHHGADDNASGVAGLIELVRMLSTQNPKPRRTIVFIAFSGEARGSDRIELLRQSSCMPLANTIAMINMDMIGRLKDQKLIVGGVGTAQEWKDEIRTLRNSPPRQEAFLFTLEITLERRRLSIAVALTLNEDGYGPAIILLLRETDAGALFWTGNHEDYH